MYKLRFCTTLLYKLQLVLPLFATEFDNEIISTCTRGMYKLDSMKIIK